MPNVPSIEGNGADGSNPLALLRVAEMAGFFMAHAIWCVEDGETLTPMIGHEGSAGKELTRFDFERSDEAVQTAKEWMATNPDGVDRAVLIYDGYLTRDGVRRDALVAMAVEFGPPEKSIQILQPYRHALAAGGFAVHRPKFIIDFPVDLDPLVDAFYKGVAGHEKGSASWARYLDETS